MSRDILVEELRRDRDAAIEEADYERQRAEIAAQRAETLRAETQRLRARVQELLDRPAAAPSPEGDDRLRLALDSNRRLERLRTRLEAELAEVKTALTTEHETSERLRRRVRALEVQVRLAQDGTAPDPELL
ncbi:MAG: hypothetical protein IPI35_10875 [Deltaproteobacteria bacterium]|nr:hypothetical protein [Deltaproteobacteria bacterium]